MQIDRQLLSDRLRSDGKEAMSLSVQSLSALVDLKKEIQNGRMIQQSHESCPLCHQKEAVLIAEKDRLGISSRTVVCGWCGLVFNDSFFSEASAQRFYEDFWSKIQWKGEPQENFRKRTAPQAFCWKRFDFIKKNLPNDINLLKSVYEIGCGDGCNLFPFLKVGFTVAGCDFDQGCLKVGRENGINLLHGGAAVLNSLGEKADIIILSHVMEHFIDIEKELAALKNILKEDGYLYVEVPGVLNWIRPKARVISEDGYASSNDILAYLQSPHNYHFCLETMNYFLEKNGFTFIFGDEWVRSVYQFNPKPQKPPVIPRSFAKTISHLQSVENDYTSLKNLPYRFARRLKQAVHQVKVNS